MRPNTASMPVMSKRFRLTMIAIGFVLAACTSEGVPGSFADQDGRVERQFVASCQAAQDGDDVEEYCQCAFYTAAAEFGFEDFLELDDLLREDPNALSLEQRQVFEAVSLPCEFSEADVPAAIATDE